MEDKPLNSQSYMSEDNSLLKIEEAQIEELQTEDICLSVNGTKGIRDYALELREDLYYFSVREGIDLINTFTEILGKHLEQGDLIRIPRFFTLQPLMVKEKRGRNIKTGEEVNVKAQLKVKVSIARSFSQMIYDEFSRKNKK